MSEVVNDAVPIVEDRASETTPSESSTEKSLQEQLQELKDSQSTAAAARAEAAQVGEDIADLEKLIVEAEAAAASYEKLHETLQDKEAQLKAESQALINALTAVLGTDGIAAIRGIVTEQIKVVTDAETARNDAQAAVDTARDDAAEKAKALENAKAELDTWRKPGASIDKRLKLAEGLISDIKKLRNGPNRGEAYWKLALGGHGQVPGQEFLNKVLEDKPEVIAPDALQDRILEAWNEFRAARTAAATSDATLGVAQQALKSAEADFAAKSKNLIKATKGALAEREAAPDAA
jgi:hypothetical protein